MPKTKEKPDNSPKENRGQKQEKSNNKPDKLENKPNPPKNDGRHEKPDKPTSPPKVKKKILFILKKRKMYGNYGVSVGLNVSCAMVAESLRENGYDVKVVDVVDNNSIDKEVFNYKPNIVILESYWVVFSKMEVLLPKYPKIFWTVRGHSKLSFFQQEGICIEWTKEYAILAERYNNFSISTNALDFVEQMQAALNIKCDYLPNIYNPNIDAKDEFYKKCDCGKKECDCDKKENILKVGSFGAIRPLKNILLQAVLAIILARKLNKKLEFYVNGGRLEQHAEPIFKNLINLFKDTEHKLISVDWAEHSKFIRLVKEMDLGMAMSFSESYCITCADFCWNNIPIIGSKEILFLNSLYQAELTDYRDILDKMLFAYKMRWLGAQRLNKLKLFLSNEKSLKDWLTWLKSLGC